MDHTGRRPGHRPWLDHFPFVTSSQQVSELSSLSSSGVSSDNVPQPSAGSKDRNTAVLTMSKNCLLWLTWPDGQ